MAYKSRWLIERNRHAVNKSKSSNNLAASSDPVTPGYNRLSEGIRKKAPSAILCLTFCGGRKCKFDSSERWSKCDMAIDGLFSHWVTDDILAMARPSAQFIAKHDLVNQFIQLGIRTVINLQEPGEHSHCGPPLTASGFSYMPEVFMSKNIYYYSYSWRDYDNGSLDGLLDAVKVLAFSVSQGKVAVHCHAGLGRTGVLLSCYLVYINRMRANEAISLVRKKRPRAVQTSGQIEMVHEFEYYLSSCSSVYYLSIKEFGPVEDDFRNIPFSLSQHLDDQREILHGVEARTLKYIPKILYLLCERLLFICRADPTFSFSIDDNYPPFTRSFYCSRFDEDPMRHYHDEKSLLRRGRRLSFQADNAGCPKSKSFSEDINWPDEDITIDYTALPSRPIDLRVALYSDQTKVSRDDVIRSLLVIPEVKLLTYPGVRDYCFELDGRQAAWAKLASEKQPETLCALLLHWLLHLDQPVLGNHQLSYIVVYANKPDSCLARFDQATRFTLEYLLRFVQRLEPCNSGIRYKLLLRLAGVLTQQSVDIDGIHFLYSHRKRLGQGTLTGLMRFLNETLDLFDSN